MLTWCSDESIASVSIEYNYKEVEPLTATITVPPYRLLDELEKPVSILYYRDNVTNETPTPRLRQEYDLNVGVRQMIKKPII